MFETEEHKGFTINIYTDENPINPRENSNVSTFVCESRHYNLGDEHCIQDAVNSLFSSYVSSKAIIEYFCKNYGAKLIPGEEGDGCDYFYEYKLRNCESVFHIDADTSMSEDQIASQIEDELGIEEKLELIRETGEVVLFPISMYEHSGMFLWLGSKWSHCDAQWDCSSIGFAYIEKSTAKEEDMLNPGEEYHNDWKEWAYAMMKAEMNVYNQYLSGEVYGYEVVDEYGDEIGLSCWGYFDRDCMMDCAKSEIDAFLRQVADARVNNLELVLNNADLIADVTFIDHDAAFRVSKDGYDVCYVTARITDSTFTWVAAAAGNIKYLESAVLQMMANKIKERM